MRPRKRAKQTERLELDSLTTEQVVSLHERVFGPLEPKARQRILDTARRRGWGWKAAVELAA